MVTTHLPGGYPHGCRCEDCREDTRVRTRERRRRKRRAAGLPEVASHVDLARLTPRERAYAETEPDFFWPGRVLSEAGRT